MLWPQVSGNTVVAATAAAGVAVRGLAYQDFALEEDWLTSSEELEGLKCETGVGVVARNVGMVGVIYRTSKSETKTVLMESPDI